MECVVEVVPPQAGEPVFEIREPGACAVQPLEGGDR